MVGVTLLSFSLLFPYFSPGAANAEQLKKEEITTEDGLVIKEIVETENGQATFTREYRTDGTAYAELIEEDTTTIIEYNPDQNELFINGEEQEIEVFTLTKYPLKSGDFSIMAVPPGGTYMGSWDSNVSILGLTAAALSAITKAPYNMGLAAVSVLMGAGATSIYSTIYQYRYPMKCESLVYFDVSKVWTDSSRTVLSTTLESGKYFSSQPIPASCTP